MKAYDKTGATGEITITENFITLDFGWDTEKYSKENIELTTNIIQSESKTQYLNKDVFLGIIGVSMMFISLILPMILLIITLLIGVICLTVGVINLRKKRHNSNDSDQIIELSITFPDDTVETYTIHESDNSNDIIHSLD